MTAKQDFYVGTWNRITRAREDSGRQRAIEERVEVSRNKINEFPGGT